MGTVSRKIISPGPQSFSLPHAGARVGAIASHTLADGMTSSSAGTASAAVAATMAVIAEKLKTVPTLIGTGDKKKKLLAIYAIVKALRPQLKIAGSVLWRNAGRTAANRNRPSPKTYEAKTIDGNGNSTQGIEHKDLGQALRFAIPKDELRTIVLYQDASDQVQDHRKFFL